MSFSDNLSLSRASSPLSVVTEGLRFLTMSLGSGTPDRPSKTQGLLCDDWGDTVDRQAAQAQLAAAAVVTAVVMAKQQLWQQQQEMW